MKNRETRERSKGFPLHVQTLDRVLQVSQLRSLSLEIGIREAIPHMKYIHSSKPSLYPPIFPELNVV